MLLYPPNRKFFLAVSKLEELQGWNNNRFIFRCVSPSGVTHKDISDNDIWIYGDGEDARMFRLKFIEVDWGMNGKHRWMKTLELKCSEIPMPSCKVFDAIGLGFLNERPKDKTVKSGRKLLLNEEF